MKDDLNQKQKAEELRRLIDHQIEQQAAELGLDLRIEPLLEKGSPIYNLKRIAFSDGQMAELHYRMHSFYIRTPGRLIGDTKATYRTYKNHIFIGLELDKDNNILSFVVRRLRDLVPPHLAKTPEKAFTFATSTTNESRFYPTKIDPFGAKAAWKAFDGGPALFNNYSLAKTITRAIKGQAY